MKKLWFKRKTYGWGWTPVSWEGWTVTAIYGVLVFAFAFTIDDNSPRSEWFFTFIMPVTLLSFALIRICYNTGEKPKWQWGKD